MVLSAEAQREWQNTASAVGMGMGVASLGFGVSQITKRPEIAFASLAFSAVLTYALWRRR